MRRTTCLLLVPLSVALVACGTSAPASTSTPDLTVTFLDSMRVPDGLMPFGTPFGGISGIDYDAKSGNYLADSDDRSEKAPARFYTLTLPIGPDGKFTGTTPDITKVTNYKNTDGQNYPVKGIDPESIRHVPSSTDIAYSSEGDSSKFLAPFVRRASVDGTFVRDYPLPPQFIPTAGPDGKQVSGVRNNLALEGLTYSPDGSTIYTSTETALMQDGPIPTATGGSTSRILALNADTGAETGEYVYAVSPIGGPYPDYVDATGFTQKADRGVSELLAVDATHFLTIERGQIPGKGNKVQIFESATDGATSVIGKAALDGTETPMPKKLLFDFSSTGANPDNVEGITWGPVLADGTRTLVLCADDNFNAAGGQHTMFHVLAVH